VISDEDGTFSGTFALQDPCGLRVNLKTGEVVIPEGCWSWPHPHSRLFSGEFRIDDKAADRATL
jgi:hypothetical protein